MVSDAGVLRKELTAYLESRHIPDAAFDVRCMLEQVTGQKLEQTASLTPAQEDSVRGMAQRRASGEPLQYILGEWEFFGMRLFVGEGVLIPRPDTETLVETVLDWCRDIPRPRILDLCTGSGCIALALRQHLPQAQVHALERSAQAMGYARKNADYHGLDVTFHLQDALAPDAAAAFRDLDVIVSNPPYLDDAEMRTLQTELTHEPDMALSGGADGLHFYRQLTAGWKQALRPGGLLAYEIGETQGDAVSEILRSHNFRDIQVIRDLARQPRVVTGIRSI